MHAKDIIIKIKCGYEPIRFWKYKYRLHYILYTMVVGLCSLYNAIIKRFFFFCKN